MQKGASPRQALAAAWHPTLPRRHTSTSSGKSILDNAMVAGQIRHPGTGLVLPSKSNDIRQWFMCVGLR